jgi:hypothetical protein
MKSAWLADEIAPGSAKCNALSEQACKPLALIIISFSFIDHSGMLFAGLRSYELSAD